MKGEGASYAEIYRSNLAGPAEAPAAGLRVMHGHAGSAAETDQVRLLRAGIAAAPQTSALGHHET